jgi:hypothetical protein
MTVDESSASRKAPACFGKALPPTAALSPKRVGMQSQLLGTMGTSPEFTTETCAKFSYRRQSRILHSDSPTKPLAHSTYGAPAANLSRSCRFGVMTVVSDPQARCRLCPQKLLWQRTSRSVERCQMRHCVIQVMPYE